MIDAASIFFMLFSVVITLMCSGVGLYRFINENGDKGLLLSAIVLLGFGLLSLVGVYAL